MFIYDAISLLCCVVLAVALLALVCVYLGKNRVQRIRMARNFRNGPCGIIYIIAVPLYFIGYLYAAVNNLDITTLFDAFFGALGKVLGLVILQYDLTDISSLIEDSAIYAVAVYACSWLVFFNTIAFVFSLMGQHLYEFYNRLKMYLTSKPRVYVFGCDNDCRDIIYSANDMTCIMVDNIKQDMTEELYQIGIPYCASPSPSIVKSIVKLARNRKKKTVVIINTGDDSRNISISRAFVGEIAVLDQSLRMLLSKKLAVYVFASSEHEEDYSSIVESGDGMIRCVNKHKMLAIDFIKKYPLSFFFNDDQIDYSTSFIRNDVDVNVVMLGFGDDNKEVFLASVASNQLIADNNGEVVQKPIKYHIFEKEKNRNNSDLNHTYYRYKQEVLQDDANKYLPLPGMIADECFYDVDVRSENFYPQLREILSRSDKDANFIIIAIGSDIQNVNLARKIIDKRREWNLSNLVIFVKTDKAFYDEMIEREQNCFFIGDFKSCAYNIEKIMSESVMQLAMFRNETYEVEHATKIAGALLSSDDIKTIRECAEHKWFASLTQQKRDSNLYCCLSIRFKLNLMGLDLCPDDDEHRALASIGEKEYFAIYAKDDEPIKATNDPATKRPIFVYPTDVKKSRRTNMAIHEHIRWNSFMLCRGYVPATIDQILNETDGGVYTNGRCESCRRHGNITTFAGLVEFRKIVAKRDGVDEYERDVISYDFQLLDDAYPMLTSCGYKIVSLEKSKCFIGSKK